MVPNYERILQIAVEDGIEKGLYSLEKTDIENLNEDELITILTNHVMGEIVEWLYWRT
jgi:hypothetical protein